MSCEPIQVYIRFRPLNPQEVSNGEKGIWYLTKNTVSLRREEISNLNSEKRISTNFDPNFHFNQVFSWEENNRKVYETVAQRVVLSALEGFNATIFAYGQTGSGKTYTMIGTKETEKAVVKPKSRRTRSRSATPKPRTMNTAPVKGLVEMALHDIFDMAKDIKDKHFFFTCSMMEIYNEHVFDLLKDTEDMSNEILTVNEGQDKEFCVRGLSEQVVNTIEEVLERLKKGEENRHYAATNLNHQSSRSHTIFRLNIRSLQVIPKRDFEAETEDSFENITTESVVNFVDLAGSERTCTVQALDPEKVTKTNSFSFIGTRSEQDKIVAESKNINTSLFYLCQVINKLSEQKMGMIKSEAHIPYRNSNLTKILRSSLGGNSRTCIICTATPVVSQFEQTLSTLRFGNSARTITNNVKANIRRETNAQLLLAYQQDIEDLKKELEVAKEKGWNFYNENTQLKHQLEARIHRLTEKLYNQSKPEIVTIQRESFSKFTSHWTSGVGDLFLVNQTVEEETPKVLSNSNLKFDSAGEFALERLNTVCKEKEEVETQVQVLSQTVANLKAAKCSLVSELDKFSNLYQKTNNETLDLRNQLSKSKERVAKLRHLVKIYEEGEGLEALSDDQLHRLERILVNRIDNVKQIRASRVYESMLGNLQEKLLNFLPEKSVMDLFSGKENFKVASNDDLEEFIQVLEESDASVWKSDFNEPESIRF